MMKTAKLPDFKQLFRGKKGGWLLTLLGLGGILLIFASTLTPKKSSADTVSRLSMDDYTAQIEEKLERIVRSISGADKVEVMVTLETGYEYVYADEIKTGTDKTEEASGGETRKSQQKETVEQNYILVEDSAGRQIALQLTELSPRVKGVVIVCPGAGDEYIRGEIISAVMAALDLSSRRVYVTG